MLALEAVERGPLAVAVERGRQLLGEGQERAGVALADGVRARPRPRAARARTRGSARASRTAARRQASSLRSEALVHERRQAVEHILAEVRGRSADRLRAVGRSKPPMNTASRSNRRQSGASSRSWLHAIAPRSDRWRSGTSAAPPPGRSSRPSSRSWIAAGVQEPDPRGGQLDGQRHAAEVGDDRRRRRRRWRPVIANPGLDRLARGRRTAGPPRTAASASGSRRRIARRAAARARAALRRSRSAGAGRPGTGYSCSPEMRSGARLVARIRIRAARRSSSADVARRAPTHLLEVVEHEQDCFGPRARRPGRRAGCATGSLGHAHRARDRRRDERRVRDRRQRHEPDAVRERVRRRLAATWSARRVLPVPPGPVSVSSRALAEQRPDLDRARARAPRTP